MSLKQTCYAVLILLIGACGEKPKQYESIENKSYGYPDGKTEEEVLGFVGQMRALRCEQNLFERVGITQLGVQEKTFYGKKYRQNASWAQNQIGSIEVKNYLDKRRFKLRPVNVGLIDRGIYLTDSIKVDPELLKTCSVPESCLFLKKRAQDLADPDNPESKEQLHGTHVATLMAGRYPISVGFAARLNKPMESGYRGFYTDNVSYFDQNQYGGLAEVINISMGPKYGDFDFAIKHWEDIFSKLPSKSIIVYSAGNSFPEKIMFVSTRKDIVVVGSTDPDGLPSYFSQEGDVLSISAPSSSGDKGVRTRGKQGRLDLFSGTSGAAPMVSAGISNIVSLLPGLGRVEAQYLIQKSAIKTNGFVQDVPFGGPGVINAYKLFRIAEKLANRWPDNRNRITEASLYDFDAEASILLAFSKMNIAKGDCQSEEKAFLQLRESFFLNPSDYQVRRLLAEYYRKYDYRYEAEFYDAPEKMIKMQTNRIFLSAVAQGDFDRVKQNYSHWKESKIWHRPTSFLSPLAWAVRYLQFDIIDFLIEKGENLETATPISMSFKHCRRKNNVKIAKTYAKLAKLNSDIKKAIAEESYLYSAVAQKCSVDVIRKLVEMGADIHGTNEHYKSNLVGQAVTYSDLSVLRYLLLSGVDPNYISRDKYKETPLMKAMLKKNVQAFRQLIYAGARVDIKNAKGETVLDQLEWRVQTMQRRNPEKYRIYKEMYDLARYMAVGD